MDSAPENTSSTPSQETSAASQKTTPVSRHSLSQVPQESHLPRWRNTQPREFFMAQSQVSQKEADAQADSQDSGDLFFGRSVQSSQTGSYSWSPPKPPPGSHTPNALPGREADEQEVPPSAPETPQKGKKYHPSGPRAKYARVMPGPRSGSAGSSSTAVKKSIELLHAQRSQVLLQRRQEKDDGRQIELESKARRIEIRIQREQMILERYLGRSPPAQAPQEGQEDQPLLTPKHTTPLRSEDVSPYLPAREEEPSPKVLPAAGPGPVHNSLDPAPCEPGPGDDRPATPRTPVQVGPSRPEPRESPEDEWMDIKLEDAEILLGYEEWEDDIVSKMIPNGDAQNAWWLNMNP